VKVTKVGRHRARQVDKMPSSIDISLRGLDGLPTGVGSAKLESARRVVMRIWVALSPGEKRFTSLIDDLI